MQRRHNLSVFFYLEELTAKIVAQTGIPSDRFHMGKIILQSLKNNLDLIAQIDGAHDQYETNRSVLERSVRCAISLKSMGLQRGDVMIIMAPNHVDAAIPLYAATYLGIVISGIDMNLGLRELVLTFETQKPKIVFCQTNKSSDVETALKKSNNVAHVITFDEGSKFNCFSDLLKKGNDGSLVEDFKPTNFDAEETTGILLSTSGSTGLPKAAELTHKNYMMALPHWTARFNKFPTPTRLYLLVSPLQWLTATVQYISSPIFQYTRLQTSGPSTMEHVRDLINKYKPTSAKMGPSLITALLTGDRDKCDLTCLEVVGVGGSYVPRELIDNLKLVDPSTLKEDIDEPDVAGELWLKGPSVFKGYYNDPETTNESFSKDGWYKTGDLFKRDSSNYLYYIDRLKSLLKYKNHQVSPIELEGVIRQHPRVQDVLVIGIPDVECGDLPAACVVVRPGAIVTAQEVKDIVKENLTDTKQLRGGVIFVKELPLTANGKLDRPRMKKIALG